MMQKHNAKFIFSCCILIVTVWAAGLLFSMTKSEEREVRVESNLFTESPRELPNPNRGFYKLYSFLITDEKQDYPEEVSAVYQGDGNTRLTLVQICLMSYREGSITKEGLSNIEALFEALEALDKQLIVRFTYDIEGQNEKYEPDSLDIILTHMEQLSHILQKYNHEIFSLQGLFIGNWGEMNGTKFNSDKDLRRLAEKLADATEQSTYLAVRSPAQWRSIMRSHSWQSKKTLADRLGLFNDGMLGNRSDYGTYETGENADDGMPFPRLEREEELKFQNGLCSEVPNGGEVIHSNVYNDLDSAIKDFETMHVTYLNKVYDQEVLQKWADTVITETGCFKGMDGLTYMERHLGYRLMIEHTNLHYQSKEETLTAEVTLKNIGFAPLYKETKVQIILYNEKNRQTFSYPVAQNLRALSGGTEKEDTLTLSVNIPFHELSEREYTVYFSIMDSDTGELILLANEEDAEWYGYRIGKVRRS